MELGKAREFASAQRKIIEDVKRTEPGTTGYEKLPPRQRFDGLWERLDQLATLAPGYDGLDRSQIAVKDSADLSVSISRNVVRQESTVHTPYPPDIKTITAVLSGPSATLDVEELNDRYIDTGKDVERLLGLLEETEQAVITMIDEQREREATYADTNMYRDDHW
jgi:hypothetical protein